MRFGRVFFLELNKSEAQRRAALHRPWDFVGTRSSSCLQGRRHPAYRGQANSGSCKHGHQNWEAEFKGTRKIKKKMSASSHYLCRHIRLISEPGILRPQLVISVISKGSVPNDQSISRPSRALTARMSQLDVVEGRKSTAKSRVSCSVRNIIYYMSGFVLSSSFLKAHNEDKR